MPFCPYDVGFRVYGDTHHFGPELQFGNVTFVETHDFVRSAAESPNPGYGHHEFGNAETYFLVGDALGKGMLTLLTGLPPLPPKGIVTVAPDPERPLTARRTMNFWIVKQPKGLDIGQVPIVTRQDWEKR